MDIGYAQSMRLDAETIGDLRKNMRKEREFVKRIAVSATKEATNGLKKDLRQDVVGGGLGARLSRSWRSKFFEDGSGIDVKGFVYSRAAEIIESFDQGVLIKSRGGRFLAIPTQNAPKRINRRKPTPDLYTQHKGPLRYVKTKGSTAFLVADDRRASYSRKTGEFRGFRKASKTALRTGKGLTTVVMFILIPTAKIPKKLDVQKVADEWGTKHINILENKYK